MNVLPCHICNPCCQCGSCAACSCKSRALSVECFRGLSGGAAATAKQSRRTPLVFTCSSCNEELMIPLGHLSALAAATLKQLYLPFVSFTCRSRSEESMIPLGYLEMLHANHEDWLHEQSVSADELARHPLSHAEGVQPWRSWHETKLWSGRSALGGRTHSGKPALIPSSLHGKVFLKFNSPPALPCHSAQACVGRVRAAGLAQQPRGSGAG